jgi:hypothetical protein
LVGFPFLLIISGEGKCYWVKWEFKRRWLPGHISNMKQFSTVIITTIGVIVGAVAGYAYYHFYGCASGTCAITSNPYISTGYGMVMGGLFVNTFISTTKTSKK